ncbi:transcriptional repressor LexA [Limnoglobus roseus]|uniref:LexA repressor n=1 Tax=Limnoglobus roseus TaxID=2598579 RepID=A0A5C1AKP5_9BACT|nr:transcriptional repressor LexA [Limnoglobus roseus]QEL18282.1 transcriptional repressor LexA [Limnoglobus roseus]
MPDANLTPKQGQIYNFICDHIQSMGYPPTIRDICKKFDISSPNGVMCHLKALEKKGMINRNRNLSRGITIQGVNAGGYSLPLLGVVAAGKAIETTQQDERLEIRDLFPNENVYALKVRGSSMIDGHIAEGDYVLIRKQESADNGSKVVAMVDKAMTLKKYYKRKDSIELHPMNASMSPIKVDPSRQEVQILGVLVGVVRKC